MTRPTLLGVSGSLRAQSYNTAVLNALKAHITDLADMTLFPLNDIPVFNADLDTDTPPEAVTRLRVAMRAADGLVLCSPEYNHGTSGVMKNALDWASSGTAAYADKPVLIMSASPASTGGVRAHQQISDTLIAGNCKLVGGAQVVIGNVTSKMEDGCFTDKATLDFMRTAVDRLLAL